MNCPVCSSKMSEKDFGNIKVDVCEGCKGLWFDWFELSKLDEKNEGFGTALKNALNAPRNNDDDREQINCPKCSAPMFIHKYKGAKEVNVDECYACGGFYLDSGELRVIRETHMSEAEEKEYLRKLVSEVPSFIEAQRDISREKVRSEALNRFTRFLRISYYVTGK